ncbi:MAG: ATPase, T2SS/T4P/T4SS family [Minisyncoccia bacterium]|jgi:type IV pilus assembly protein PilB
MQKAVGWLETEFLSDDEMRRARAKAAGVPFVVLLRDDIVPEALMLIPEPLSRTHGVVAYRNHDGTVEVAMLDIAALEHLAFLQSHIKIRPRLTDQASITRALQMYQKHLKEKFGGELQAGSAEALVLHAALSRASDVHLDVSPKGTRVRYRIQGALHEAMHLGAEAGTALVQSIKSAAKLFPIAVAQEGKYKIAPSEQEGETVLVSVANVPGVDGEKLILRLSNEYAGQRGFTLSALGLHGAELERVHRMLHARSGLVLIAGKSGSGKTTCAYTLLDQLEESRTSIVTIEEEIEHRLPYATQTRTRPETGFTMQAGVRAALRTDSDVVMISGIDSAEVAQLALEAANRGMLVFAAIDAKNASYAIETLLSFDISPRLIAANLLGVVGVQIAHKLGEGKEPGEKLSREDGARLEQKADFGRVLAALKEESQVHEHSAWKDIVFYKSENGKGYVGIQEVLAVTPVLKEMILQKAGAEDIEATAREEGMLTFAEEALFKAAQGSISLEEAVNLASE